jgi:hypothetical protein
MVRPLAIERRQDSDHAVGFGRTQASHYLVKKKQLGVSGQRDGEPLASGRVGPAASWCACRKVEPAQHLVRMAARRGESGVRHRPDNDIVLDRQCGNGRAVGACYSATADFIRPEPVNALIREDD